jgi:hypothetical protein
VRARLEEVAGDENAANGSWILMGEATAAFLFELVKGGVRAMSLRLENMRNGPPPVSYSAL